MEGTFDGAFAAGGRGRAPLAGHVLFRSRDLDCAREEVARKFCRHRLEIVGGARLFDAEQRHAAGAGLSLNVIRYGADVLIDPGALGDFYLIQMPIRGAATIRNGNKEFLTDRNTASVLNADLPTVMHWWRGCEQLLVQLPKATLTTFAERLLDRTLPGPIVFDPVVDFARPELAAWRGFVGAMFCAAGERPIADPAADLGTVFAEERLLEAFLRAQPSNVSLFFDDAPQSARPRHLKRAEAFIRARCAEPIGLLDIAAAAGVTPRTLQLAYRQVQGMSPMQALQRERLRRVRIELLADGADVTVAGTALKWGFCHLGRFAAAYRREFGEGPRDSLGRGGTRMRHEAGGR